MFLTAMLMLCIGGIVASWLVIPGSGYQFARLVNRNWGLGRISLDGARAIDLNTVQFSRLRILADPPVDIDGRYLIELEDAKWQRATLMPHGRLSLDAASLRFTTGDLRLVWQGEVWNFSNVLPQPSWRWREELPAQILGEEVYVRAAKRSTSEPAKVQFWAHNIDWRSQGDQSVLRCTLRGDAFREGTLIWTAPNGAGSSPESEASLQVHIDDVVLAEFPFADLRRLFRLPWPLTVPRAQGRADLDWTLQGSESRLDLVHYQSTLEIPGLPSPLGYLSGSATLTEDHAHWQIDQGNYSQSSLKGVIDADLLSGEITGKIFLEKVLDDRGIAEGFSAGWRRFFSRMSLTGWGVMDVELKGKPSLGMSHLLRSIRLSVEGAALLGEEHSDSVTGDIQFVPGDARWDFTARTASSDVHGLRLPSSEWEGWASGNGLSLKRVDQGGPRISVVVTAEKERDVTYNVHIRSASMTGMLRRPLGDATWEIDMAGSWNGERGAQWDRASIKLWKMTIPPEVAWPVVRPGGTIDGELNFHSEFGIVQIDSVNVKDGQFTWQATGEIGGDGRWDLRGTVESHKARAVTSELPERNQLRESRSFQLTGPFLNWKIMEEH
ncbi:MAG: hypothetical protein V3T77_09575 [Planctomycetota bacterium]